MPRSVIVYSDEALADLDSICDHIAAQSGGPRAAAVMARIQRTVATVSFVPGIGRKRKELRGEPHVFPAPPWLIIYRPLSDRRGILVLRIVDGRRDVADIL